MIILVAGAAGSGKGQASETMVKLLQAKEISFAQPMKRWAVEYFDFSPYDCYNSKEEAVRAGIMKENEVILSLDKATWGKTPESRRFLQRLGDLMKDRVGLHFWAREASQIILDILREGEDDPEEWISASADSNFVISDWRFPYEGKVIRDDYVTHMPVYTVRIIRSDLPPIEAGADHASETSLTDDMNYDKKIYNDGSLADLEKKVTEWVEEISAATTQETTHS